MEYRELGSTGLHASVIGLGTWVTGGLMWGGADEHSSIAAIREALDLGVTLIDTAPIYGYGRAETLVGQALRESGQRDKVIVATKVGLEWDAAHTRVWRNASPSRIHREIEGSLRQLGIDVIDLYQIHWPDESHPFEATMEALLDLQGQGKIRFIGVSNFSVRQMEQCLAIGAVHTAQPPYNLFEREIESEVLPFCRSRNLGTLTYGSLCRGLLSGKYAGQEIFEKGDVRAVDPKFNSSAFQNYVRCVTKLKDVAYQYGKTVGQLAVRWCLDQAGVDVALCGIRSPAQIQELSGATGWTIEESDQQKITRIVEETIAVPVEAGFMAPP